MKIFLEAFVDTNFGDNLFVHTIVNRYSKHEFYMIPNSGYEESYNKLLLHEKNIRLVELEQEEAVLKEIDGIIIVGGDMFWDYGDYTTIIRRIGAVKKNQGWLAILGISLFENYSVVTTETLKEIFLLADHIVVRDKQSFAQVKRIAKEANATLAADMAVTFNLNKVKRIKPLQGVLGVSVRKKIPRNTEDYYTQYCKDVAEFSMAYLDEADFHNVHFLALSTGSSDDRAVARDIIAQCDEKYHERMKIIPFTGNVEAYIEEMQKCKIMVCTRFHSMVFALMLEKPFVPIIYEEKMKRVLQEIAYYGEEPAYEDRLYVWRIFGALDKRFLDEELRRYLRRGKRFFKQTDQWLLSRKLKRKRCSFWGKVIKR